MPPSETPVNVRLVDMDGNEYPVQVAFVGHGLDGTAVWEVVDCPPVQWRLMKVDMLPAHTSIRLPVVLDE